MQKNGNYLQHFLSCEKSKDFLAFEILPFFPQQTKLAENKTLWNPDTKALLRVQRLNGEFN